MRLEDKFCKIDTILEKLDQNDIGLDEAFKLYNEGMNLIYECNESIDKVEKELIILNEKSQDE